MEGENIFLEVNIYLYIQTSPRKESLMFKRNSHANSPFNVYWSNMLFMTCWLSVSNRYGCKRGAIGQSTIDKQTYYHHFLYCTTKILIAIFLLPTPFLNIWHLTFYSNFDHQYSLNNALFAWLISHQPTVLFSQNKPAISNQPEPASSTLLSE
jgi:hypothetical protein